MLRFIRNLTGIPFSITLHAADIYAEPHSTLKTCQDAAFFITISQYNKTYLVKEVGLPEKRIHVVHCGVDPDLFSPTEMDDKKFPLILSVGRLTEKKGFDLLVSAFKLLADRGVKFKAKIVGDGPLMKNLSAAVNNAALTHRVELAGAMSHGQVIKEIHRCDLFVLACRQATSGDIDGIPVVLMEAMAAGKPVVSTIISGIPELVRPGCGLLCRPEDPAAIAQAMHQILESQDRATQMGQSGRALIKRSFSKEKQISGLVNLIKQEQKKDKL